MGESQSGSVDGIALAKSLAIMWAAAVVLLGLLARYDWGTEWRDLISDVYLGYDSSRQGLVVGSLWAFADGFLGGYFLAWLYNKFA
ncbi:MAG: bacteriophage holin [Halodesulfurarchaeum sp.]